MQRNAAAAPAWPRQVVSAGTTRTSRLAPAAGDLPDERTGDPGKRTGAPNDF